MAISMFGKHRVYIQSPDGETHEVTGHMTNMSLSQRYNGLTELELTITGDGVQHYLSGEIKERKATQEWCCDFCGRVNQRKDEYCKSCGAVRSFTV